MSQQTPEQPHIDTNIAVTIYQTSRESEIALRELERFEKLVHLGKDYHSEDDEA